MQQVNNNTIKIKSSISFKVGTILTDNDTRETFEVMRCERIGLLEDFKFGLTLNLLGKKGLDNE